jgi:hypothetical protein
VTSEGAIGSTDLDLSASTCIFTLAVLMQSFVLFADASLHLLKESVRPELRFMLGFVLELAADEKEAKILLVAVERRKIDM